MKLERQQLLGLLAALLTVPVEKVTEYADSEEDDNETALTDLHKAVLKKKFEDGHKKALKLATTNTVKELKNAFGVDIEGDSLEEIATSLKEHLDTEGAGDLSEDAVKQHPTFKAVQAELIKVQKDQKTIIEKEVKKLSKEKDTEYEAKLKQADRKTLDIELELEAEQWLVKEGAILSEDPKKRKKQVKELVAKLAADELEKDEDGSIALSDGTTLEDRFKEYDYLFAFTEVQQRKSTQLPANGGKKTTQTFQHFKGELPKNKEEMDQVMIDFANKKIKKEEYHEVKKAYEASLTT